MGVARRMRRGGSWSRVWMLDDRREPGSGGGGDVQDGGLGFGVAVLGGRVDVVVERVTGLFPAVERFAVKDWRGIGGAGLDGQE